IEETQRPDAIKLIDNENLDQKINNSKLSTNLINDLQKLRISRLDKLHFEQKSYYNELKDKTEVITTLNNLFDTINNNKVLTDMQKSVLLKSINDKIFKINQKQEYDLIKNGIIKEKDSQYKSDIKNKAFISNLLDEKLFDILITNDSLLTTEQKNQLHVLRKQRIQILTDKIFDELKNNIKNKKVSSKLEDKGYYNSRIGEIHKEFLTNNRKLKDLYIHRRWKLDMIQ
ncbi:1036_t:CDS:2, partial [Racocetra persica]